MNKRPEISSATYDDVIKALDTLDALETPSSQLGIQIEREIGGAIEPLLVAEGYEVKQEIVRADRGLDLLAVRSSESIVFEYKFYQRARLIGPEVIRQLIESADANNVSKAIVIANTGYSEQAMDLARSDRPLNLQLLNFEAIRNWATRLHRLKQPIEVEVSQIMRDASQKLAELVAMDGNALASMEWRDVERVMAEVFEGLGFETELTPPSKDGGKDVIVRCFVKGQVSTYYVEIKHWRSATKVGSSAVQDLINVVVNENVTGGLFLSTYGFTANAFEQLTVLDQNRVKFGN